jgi:hypothetical protein
MKTVSFAVALLTLVMVAGCDHLRSRDASADEKEKVKTAETGPASTMPGGDRYGANAGAATGTDTGGAH